MVKSIIASFLIILSAVSGHAGECLDEREDLEHQWVV